MKVVSDWRNVWKYYSTQALIALAALPIVWAELPPDVKDLIPHDWRGWIFSGIAVAGAASRYVKQAERDD